MYMIKLNFHQEGSTQKYIFSATHGTKVYEFTKQLNVFFNNQIILEFEGYQLHPDTHIGLFDNKELQGSPFEEDIIINLDHYDSSDLDELTQVDPREHYIEDNHQEDNHISNDDLIKIQPGQIIRFKLDLDGYYRGLECGYDIQDEAIYEVTFVDQVKRLIGMDSGNLIIGYKNMIIL